MEFVGFGEVWPELKARGVVETHRDDVALELSIDPSRHPVTLDLCPAAGTDASPSGSTRIPCPAERLAAALEAVLHKLRLAPLYIVPVGTWRSIFDIVTFGLAANEQWQEIDAQASVEQNTRDALVCGPRDFHTVRELVRVLLADGEPHASQALTIIATGQALVARAEPKSPVRIVVASSAVADLVRDAAVHFLNGAAPHG